MIIHHIKKRDHKVKKRNLVNRVPDNLEVGLRVVTKISSCRVNTTSRRGIKQLGFLLVLFFFCFPIKVAGGHTHSSRVKSLAPGS